MTRLGELGELGLLKRLLPHLAAQAGELAIGPGEDDAAAWREPGGGFTVATCDTAVEGVHFDLRWLSPEQVGWRTLALALGDLAAKGASPTYGLVSLSAPAWWEVEVVDGIYRGLSAVCAETGLRLAGGDTTSTPGPASLTVACLGRTETRPLPRSAARPGWSVAVTGRLGAAAAALAAAAEGRPVPPEWSQALFRPLPRLAEGAALAAAGLCCGDVSDGLLREMDKFAAASGAGCELRLDSVPVAPGVPAELALASGEEVELVCVGPPELVAEAARALPGGLLSVGLLTEGGRVRVLDSGGAEVPLAERGFDHFA